MQKINPEKADIFSLGVIMYRMLTQLPENKFEDINSN